MLREGLHTSEWQWGRNCFEALHETPSWRSQKLNLTAQSRLKGSVAFSAWLPMCTAELPTESQPGLLMWKKHCISCQSQALRSVVRDKRLLNMHACVCAMAVAAAALVLGWGCFPLLCCGSNYQASDGARGQQVSARGSSGSKPVKIITLPNSRLCEITACRLALRHSLTADHISAALLLWGNKAQSGTFMLCSGRMALQTDRETSRCLAFEHICLEHWRGQTGCHPVEYFICASLTRSQEAKSKL